MEKNPLTIEEVAQAAYDAGFRGESLVTAVAIARGESGWDSNATGDVSLETEKWGPSVGLFQVRTLRDQTGTGQARDIEQLYDPAFNAQAAFEISSGGRNFQPWTVFTKDIYLQHMDQARSVVAALEADGTFAAGTIDVPGSAADFADAVGDGDGDYDVDEQLRVFLEAALAQRGDEYVFGATADPEDFNPEEFDCAELVQWAAARAGVELPTGSWLQYLELKQSGDTVPLATALETPGALLFRFSSEPVPGGGRPPGSHVAISLGNGKVMEARSTKAGVNIFDASDIEWTHGGVIPEFADATPGQAAPPTEPLEYGQDSDNDGIWDSMELIIGTDPFSEDTDRDGFLDADEVLGFESDPLDYADNALAEMSGDAPTWAPPLTNAGKDQESVEELVEALIERKPPSYDPPPPAQEPEVPDANAAPEPEAAEPQAPDPNAAAEGSEGTGPEPSGESGDPSEPTEESQTNEEAAEAGEGSGEEAVEAGEGSGEETVVAGEDLAGQGLVEAEQVGANESVAAVAASAWDRAVGTYDDPWADLDPGTKATSRASASTTRGGRPSPMPTRPTPPTASSRSTPMISRRTRSRS